MSRPLKSLLAVFGFLLLLIAAGAAMLRSTRGEAGTPVELRPTVLTITNGHVAITAAQVKDGIVLFDTGQDPQGHALLTLLHSMNAVREDVHDVFLTHGHGDHLSGVPLLPHARIWAGEGDVDLASGKVAPQAMLARIFGWIFRPPSVTVSNALHGIVDIPVKGLTDVRCFPMPGHTPGSYAFLYARILFVGDTMNLVDGRLAPQMAAFDPAPEENRAAIRALNEALASQQVDRICTAHGGCTEPGDGRALLDAFAKSLHD